MLALQDIAILEGYGNPRPQGVCGMSISVIDDQTLVGVILKNFKYSTQFLGFWTPSPLVCILARSIALNPRNLPYFICMWYNPLPLSMVDII